MYTYVQSSSFLSSPPDRCGCPPRRRCSVPACRPSACSSQRSRLQNSTHRRRRGRSSAARSARQSARLGTSPLLWQVFSWSPDGSRGCSGCLHRQGDRFISQQCECIACVSNSFQRVEAQPTRVFSRRFGVPGFNDQRKSSLERKKDWLNTRNLLNCKNIRPLVFLLTGHLKWKGTLIGALLEIEV